jgi:hypothetical protein
MVQSYARKGNIMYNIARQQPSRIAIGSSGRMHAAELARLGRQRRLGIGRNHGVGQMPTMVCNTGSGIPQNCAPPLQVCPENQKRYIMPFIPNAGFTASVTAGSTVEFVGRPQKLFKPDRLIVASTIAPFFNIVSLLIANVPQSLSAGAVAADIYSEVATNMEMSFDQAYPGIDVILTAVNKSSVTQTFQVQLAGWAVG